MHHTGHVGEQQEGGGQRTNNKRRQIERGSAAGGGEAGSSRGGESESNYPENKESISINLYMSIPQPHPLLVACALNTNDSHTTEKL